MTTFSLHTKRAVTYRIRGLESHTSGAAVSPEPQIHHLSWRQPTAGQRCPTELGNYWCIWISSVSQLKIIGCTAEVEEDSVSCIKIIALTHFDKEDFQSNHHFWSTRHYGSQFKRCITSEYCIFFPNRNTSISSSKRQVLHVLH